MRGSGMRDHRVRLMLLGLGDSVDSNDRWFVTNGTVAVGPVSFGLLLRGVAHGRLSCNSFVRHESWRVWRRLDELEALSPDHRRKTIDDLATSPAALDEFAGFEGSGLSRLPDDDEEVPAEPRLWPTRLSPAAADPLAVLSNATELREALMLSVVSAVAVATGDIGVVYRARGGFGGTVAVGSHGAGTEHLLGKRLDPDDPVMAEARAGRTLLSEPGAGVAARATFARLSRCMAELEGVAMVPLLHYGELVAFFELGRRGSYFRARDIARVEEVVEVLADRTALMGWL